MEFNVIMQQMTAFGFMRGVLAPTMGFQVLEPQGARKHFNNYINLTFVIIFNIFLKVSISLLQGQFNEIQNYL